MNPWHFLLYFLTAVFSGPTHTAAAVPAPAGDVRQWGAVGDGMTDDTRAIRQAVKASAGKTLHFGDGLRFLVSGTISLESNSTYTGKSTIVAKAGLGLINNAVLYAKAKHHIFLKGLRIDCNGDKEGIGNGLWFDRGYRNTAEGIHVSNSMNSGIRVNAETNTRILNSRLTDCGRKGYSDNHAVMLYTTSGDPVADIEIRGNEIIRAFRKGIATYSSAGPLRDLLISDNKISGCGLAGIYIGGTASPYHKRIRIENNDITNCYQGIAAYRVDDLILDKNRVTESTGGDGFNLSGINYGEISGNRISESAATGLNIINSAGRSERITISNNTITNSNRLRSGYAPAINLSAISSSNVWDNIITDTGREPLTTFGIYEQPGSNYNVIKNNSVNNMKVRAIIISGKGSILKLKP